MSSENALVWRKENYTLWKKNVNSVGRKTTLKTSMFFYLNNL